MYYGSEDLKNIETPFPILEMFVFCDKNKNKNNWMVHSMGGRDVEGKPLNTHLMIPLDSLLPKYFRIRTVLFAFFFCVFTGNILFSEWRICDCNFEVLVSTGNGN